MIFCYPQDRKPKSAMICDEFARGCNGQVVTDGKYRGGAAMFYGIDERNENVWRCVRDVGEDWIYTDNAYFDRYRGTYFRATKNRLQQSGTGVSNGYRFDKLGLKIEPWRVSGGHILVTPQSDHFMRVAAGYAGNWVDDTVSILKQHTDREIRVRPWNRDKVKAAQELPAALKDAWALVTYSSASAVTALLMGIPVVVTAGDCIARPMAGRLEDIENPPTPDNRREWAGILADHQFTLDEYRSGYAWSVLNG